MLEQFCVDIWTYWAFGYYLRVFTFGASEHVQGRSMGVEKICRYDPKAEDQMK